MGFKGKICRRQDFGQARNLDTLLDSQKLDKHLAKKMTKTFIRASTCVACPMFACYNLSVYFRMYIE